MGCSRSDQALLCMCSGKKKKFAALQASRNRTEDCQKSIYWRFCAELLPRYRRWVAFEGSLAVLDEIPV
jgi:hypothetical protein